MTKYMLESTEKEFPKFPVIQDFKPLIAWYYPRFSRAYIFSRFSDKSDGHAQKANFSHLKPDTDPSYVANFPVVAVAAFSKMPVERSGALESRVKSIKFSELNKEVS